MNRCNSSPFSTNQDRNASSFSMNQDRSTITFIMNGYLWSVLYVSPKSSYLIDRTGTLTVATTDFSTRCVYLSNELKGSFLRTVFVHELGHVTMFSYDLLPAIHAFVRPSQWIEAEEWVCNFIADYGDEVLDIANRMLSSLYILPRYSA